MRFRPAATLTPAAVAAILEQVRVRVLCGFPRRGLIDRDDVHERLAGENSGSSLDASVRVAAPDRTGLERLLRYCARPPFALERREPVNAHQVIDHLPKPRGDGRTALSLMPLECIDHLAALIPPPRRHRHRYPEELAPHSPRRAAATAYGRDEASSQEQSPPASASPPAAAAASFRSPARHLWAMAAGAPVRVPAARLSPLGGREAHDRLHHRGRPRGVVVSPPVARLSGRCATPCADTPPNPEAHPVHTPSAPPGPRLFPGFSCSGRLMPSPRALPHLQKPLLEPSWADIVPLQSNSTSCSCG